MLTPEQIARRVRQDWYRPALSSVVRTHFLCVLAELEAALKENAALRAGIKRIARKDGVCEACDTLMDEDCKPWCPRAMARALLDPQPTKPCQHVNKRKMGLDSPHRYYCPDCNTYFCWRWARKEKGS